MSILEGMGNICGFCYIYLIIPGGPQLRLGMGLGDERSEIVTMDRGNRLRMYNFNNVWSILLLKNAKRF